MKNSRHSKFELLRIVSMFLIILYHFIYHSNLIENCQNKLYTSYKGILDSQQKALECFVAQKILNGDGK